MAEIFIPKAQPNQNLISFRDLLLLGARQKEQQQALASQAENQAFRERQFGLQEQRFGLSQEQFLAAQQAREREATLGQERFTETQRRAGVSEQLARERFEAQQEAQAGREEVAGEQLGVSQAQLKIAQDREQRLAEKEPTGQFRVVPDQNSSTGFGIKNLVSGEIVSEAVSPVSVEERRERERLAKTKRLEDSLRFRINRGIEAGQDISAAIDPTNEESFNKVLYGDMIDLAKNDPAAFEELLSTIDNSRISDQEKSGFKNKVINFFLKGPLAQAGAFAKGRVEELVDIGLETPQAKQLFGRQLEGRNEQLNTEKQSLLGELKARNLPPEKEAKARAIIESRFAR